MAGSPERVSPGAERMKEQYVGDVNDYRKHRFAEAVTVLRVSIEEVPTFTPTHRTLAACYAHMDRLDEAREIIKRLVSLTPVVVPTANPCRNPEHGELFLSGLRLAMGEPE